MSERNHWKAEEKLALINEVKEKGQVVKTCWRYSADPMMFYRWEEDQEELRKAEEIRVLVEKNDITGLISLLRRVLSA